MPFLMGTVRKVGGWILKSLRVEGTTPVMRWVAPEMDC
jgi:hypothetical protein